MILILGQTGQVATALAALAPRAPRLARPEIDYLHPEAAAEALGAALDTHRPQAVVNAAAYTDVDRAEHEEEKAHVVNARAPGRLAEVCAARAIPFVHLSTDYVFAGEGTAPHAPDAPTGPLNAYGRTKRAGEEAVRGADGPHAILRTSWVFSPHGRNFVRTMLRLSESRARLDVVADQVGGPTPAAAIARACLAISERLAAEPSLSGTYHFSGAPDVSWAGFARAILAEAGRAVEVHDIATAAYPTPAARPLNGRLDCSSTQAAFGLTRPDWRTALHESIGAPA